METTEKVPVTVQEARAGTIRRSIFATGVVTPAPGAELLVTAPQPARILEIARAEGDVVRKGEILVRFEIPSLGAERAGRESDRARAQARLDNALAAEKRVEGLYERGIAAGKEVEDAKRDLAEARAALAESEKAVSAAEVLERRETVEAGFDGIVASRWHNPGDLVEASASDPILRVIDPGRLQVEAAVPLGLLDQVAVGAAARIRSSSGSGDEEGVVKTRPGAVEPSTGTAMLRVAFSRPSSLPVGTPVEIEIQGEEHAGAVVVPVAAVVRERSESFVYVVDGGGVAHRRPIGLGIVTAADAEILSGIAPGDRVVVKGQAALPDGAAVDVAP